VFTSIALLVSMSLLLFGILRTVNHLVARAVIANPVGPVGPVGYDTHMASEADPSRYVGLVESGGATSLRDEVQWAYVEPTQGNFNWKLPDEIVTQAALHHLHALLIVDTTPRWASGDLATPQRHWMPPRSAAAYGEFAAMTAARYGPDGVFWKDHPALPIYLPAGLELWNEENIDPFWGGKNPNPKAYAAMVKAAYPLIKKADPTMTVVLGGLAPAGGYDDVTCTGQTGEGHIPSKWNGVNYLQALYADGIHGYFDALGWHAYNYWTGATAVQMLAYDSCSAWSQMSDTPMSVRSLMTAHGDAAKRVWITETGAPTCTANASYKCVSPAQQADLASTEVRLWQHLSWAGGFYWYDIRDDSLGSQQVESHFGAVSSNDSPKPSYYALRQAWSPAALVQGPLTPSGARTLRTVDH
jgi:polysaccharide biosynthesis protein PslG